MDPAGPRRLARVARACKDYGVRVQKSVFECQVGETEWLKLKERLLREYQEREDSLRFYFLDENAIKRTEHHGTGKPLDLREPLVL
jgi:CRISPR-associated protein Cas2